MEFLPMKRYRHTNSSYFPPFSELKKIKPINMTMDLKVVETAENLCYLDQLASEGLVIFPVRRLTESKNVNPKFPRRVLFEMTSICNTKCQMCPQMNLKRKLVHMDKEKYKTTVDEIDRYGIEGLWIYHFGESLTHPHFKELVEYLNTKINLGYIWLSTNGILLKGDLIDFLLDSSISYLNFSLQSTTLENYKIIAPTSPAEIIFRNLNTLIEKKSTLLGRKPFFRLQIIEQQSTLNEIDQFLQQYFDKCDLISVNMLEHTDLKFNSNSKMMREHKQKALCNRIYRGDCFLNSDGSVAICDNAYNNQIDIGNIWDNTIYEIWNGSQRQKLLDMNCNGQLWDIPICAECTDYDL